MMGSRENTGGIDRVTLRLAVFGIIVFAAFVGLFSRLWFLQVLAADQYQGLAKENRVRRVYTEPPRGRILDRDGKVLVDNRQSLSITVAHSVLDEPTQRDRTLRKISRLLDVPIGDLESNLEEATVSPFKPIPVAFDVDERYVTYIEEHKPRFRGVSYADLSLRTYPFGKLAPQILGYINEITLRLLRDPHYKGATPRYAAGDIVGHSGLEYQYDRVLRGTPGQERVVVNSSGERVGHRLVQEEEAGDDIVLSLDADIQQLTQDALKAGIEVSRGQGYEAPAGGVVVMDPNTGAVLGMASFPTYNPKIAEDGFTEKEYASLTRSTPENPDGGAQFFRPTMAQKNPGSTMKAITAAAALATGVASPYTVLPCPSAAEYPPDDPGATIFRNWTTQDLGSMGFVQALEVSCDTFFYELGWDMQEQFGLGPFDGFGSYSGGEPPPAWEKPGDPKLSSDQERFQKYARLMGLGHPTGIDLPSETSGLVPDQEWCHEVYLATKKDEVPTCERGWLPGYSVNMAIGQGDLLVDPLQMAVAYGAIANGGNVMQPRLVWSVGRPDGDGGEETLRQFEPRVVNQLGLDETQLGVVREGLEQVVSGGGGTANVAFSGFPIEQFPIAGKTGTAEIGETGLNDAWFVAYGPSDDPQYVVSVYIERSGHGGENAAPVARQIFEGLFGIDDVTDVRVGRDLSG